VLDAEGERADRAISARSVTRGAPRSLPPPRTGGGAGTAQA
jgi:hypothetical protein